MKNSTILVVSTLVLGGAGAYFYFKNKKAKASDTTATTPTSTTATTTPTSTTTTTPTNDAKALQDLGVKVEEPKPTPYVAPSVPVPTVTLENIQKALLSLGIDQTRSITELSSPNYIEAKKLASNIKGVSSIYLTSGKATKGQGKALSDYYGSAVGYETGCYSLPSGRGRSCSDFKLSISKDDILKNMTKKVNELGYKVLPNFDIEKM
jgi:hypothetical protein